MYVAADGKEFQNKEVCERYEKHLNEEKTLLSQIRVWDEGGEPIRFKDVEGLERAINQGTVIDFQTTKSADFILEMDWASNYFPIRPFAGRYYYDEAKSGYVFLDEVLATLTMYAEL